MVSTINVSAYIAVKYVQIVRKTVHDLKNIKSKAIDIHHDRDGENWVESPWRRIVFKQNNNKLRVLRAQSTVHTIETLEDQIQDDLYVGKLIYIGNEHN